MEPLQVVFNNNYEVQGQRNGSGLLRLLKGRLGIDLVEPVPWPASV
jgi:hypothetical protein